MKLWFKERAPSGRDAETLRPVSDPNILGKRLRMDNDPYTIVGVVVAQVDRFRECAGASEKETL